MAPAVGSSHRPVEHNLHRQILLVQEPFYYRLSKPASAKRFVVCDFWRTKFSVHILPTLCMLHAFFPLFLSSHNQLRSRLLYATQQCSFTVLIFKAKQKPSWRVNPKNSMLVFTALKISSLQFSV